MKVVLSCNPLDKGNVSPKSRHSGQCDCDCDCNCDCACPVDARLFPILSRPLSYYLELTPSCNNHCYGCGNVYADARKKLPSPLSGANWMALIDKLCIDDNKPFQMKITGGEATLHSDFFQIITHVNELGIPFVLFSNGRWVKPDFLVSFLKKLETCDGMLISLHGPDKESHDAFTGIPGSFNETFRNIGKVLSRGIDVSTSFVLNQRNIDQVDQMMELVLGLGEEYGKTVNMICNRYIGSFLPGISPTEFQLKSAIRKIEKLHQKGYPIRFGNCIPQCFEESSSRGCSAGMSFATVDPWGNMRPCNHTAWVAGNLLEQSIEEVWQGKVMQEWRSLIPSECISCSVFSKCHGGCRAQALIVGGGKDNLAQEPLSKIPKEEYRYLYKDLQPIKHFYIQEDGKNLLAINKNKAVVLPPHQIEMINTLDGVKSLLAIKDIFGEESVDLIGILQDVGMVSWNNT